jgi:hypothetical protein
MCAATAEFLEAAIVDLHSNLRPGPIRVRSGTEIETDASLSLVLLQTSLLTEFRYD